MSHRILSSSFLILLKLQLEGGWAGRDYKQKKEVSIKLPYALHTGLSHSQYYAAGVTQSANWWQEIAHLFIV